MPYAEFKGFNKIARFNREVIVTEKIDGTNGIIHISDDGQQILAGSRTQWLLPQQKDNFGFGRWVAENQKELFKLGPGYHYGEWWGAGIQRKYGLKEKVFSLFNVSRWGDAAVRPACCSVVPVLWQGMLCELNTDAVLARLKETGSIASPGFMQPEGIVIYHTASGQLFKRTIEGDEGHKGV